MFRMLGNKVELIRYQVTYTDPEISEEMTENCISEEHKNEVEQKLTERGINFTTTAVDQTENEWFNGLTFDSYDTARAVFEAGKAAYNANVAVKTLASGTQLRADLDYLAIMAGVEI